MGILLFLLLMPVFVLLLAGAAGGPNLHRPNGYLPRGGGIRPKYYGDPIRYKHGQKVYVSSINDLLEGKPGKVKYYNKETDEFEDVKS